MASLKMMYVRLNHKYDSSCCCLSSVNICLFYSFLDLSFFTSNSRLPSLLAFFNRTIYRQSLIEPSRIKPRLNYCTY